MFFNLVSLFLGLLCVSRALSTYVTMPLYIDPSNNSWQTLYNAIAANPHLTFNLIINPNSGPGNSTYPDPNTLEGLATLNTYPNVNTLGYVHVEFCARSQSDVQADVNTYAGWAGYTGGKDIHLSGIFFDEAPADYSTSNHAYMQTVSGYAKSAFPSGNNHVTFNPGAKADSSYFLLADTICVFEDHYSSYSSNILSSIPADQKAASTIIMYGFDGSQDQQNAIVETITSSGIAGLYITASDGYTDWSPLFEQFVSSMAGSSGGVSPIPSPVSSSSTTTITATTGLSSVTPYLLSTTLNPSIVWPAPETSTTAAESVSLTASVFLTAKPEPSATATDLSFSNTRPTTLTVVPLPTSTSTSSSSSITTTHSHASHHPHHRHFWNSAQRPKL